MMGRLIFLVFFLSTSGFAQTRAIEAYLKGANADAVINSVSGTRDKAEIRNLLPHRRSNSFVEYVKSKSSAAGFASLLNSLESMRLNKLVGSTTGGSGTTSLISHVAVPAILGFGVESGSILQENNGTVSSLRGNLLGLARMIGGAEQFPYCPEIDQKNCTSAARWLRRISGVTSFENIQSKTASVSANPTNGTPVVADLFGNTFRMASWGARFDWTGTNNLDDPKYIDAWKTRVVDKLKENPAAADLSAAVIKLFEKALEDEVYTTWMSETVTVLQSAPSAPEFRKLLEARLNILISRMSENDSNFAKNVSALSKAYSNYFTVRDDLLRELQRHKFSLEYTNQHTQNQPNTSNIRLIYSHQPTLSPTLITLNTAFTFYNTNPSPANSGRLRDVQMAGQIDHRLGQIPRFGYAVAAVSFYYQWMKEDALINIGPGNAAPGSGLVLPNTAATLLGTKGHIGVVQGKLSIPIGGTLKVPISITWANRTELIKEKDVRGQIGLTLDLDSLFQR